jgi:hypothetical protein
MSLQVFLYAQFRGIERFVSGTSGNSSFADRSLWVSMLTEVTPRTFLSERGLSPMLVLVSVSCIGLLLGPFYVLLATPLVATLVTLLDVIVRDKDPAEEEVPTVLFAKESAGS